MEERGECSASAKPSDEIWAKLVPSDVRYSDVEIRSDEIVICSEISATLSDKHSWCKIVRNSDLYSATMESKSPNTILVDGAEVCNGETIVIKDGSEIIPGPHKEGFVSYRFHIMSSRETCPRQLKICMDVENAKCSICLNIWHDVVTTGPCLHNFCNGCFSEWLRRSQEKRSTVFCPQCRTVVQFVRRNPFLRTIAEDMLRADSSLRRSDEEIALLDTHASVGSNLAEGVLGAGAVHTDQTGGSGGDEEEAYSEDQDDEEETDSEDESDEEETNSSQSRSHEEIAHLDSHASVIAEGVLGAGAGAVPTDQAGGSGGDEEEETDSEDQDDEEETDSEDQSDEEETNYSLSRLREGIAHLDHASAIMYVLPKILRWLEALHMNQQMMWTRMGGAPEELQPFMPYGEIEKRILSWDQQPQSSGAAVREGDNPADHVQEDVA